MSNLTEDSTNNVNYDKDNFDRLENEINNHSSNGSGQENGSDLSFRIHNDEILDAMRNEKIPENVKIYLHNLNDDTYFGDSDDLIDALGIFDYFALKLLIQKRYLSVEMISYAFDIKMIAADCIFFSLHDVFEYVDSDGAMIEDKESSILEHISELEDLYGDGEIIVTPHQKQVLERVWFSDIEQFRMKADEYVLSHPNATLPRDCKFTITIRDDIKLNNLYYDNLTEREIEYLQAKEDEWIKSGIFDLTAISIYSDYAYKLAETKGHVNEKMISYAFDIDMITAYRILDYLIEIRNSLNKNGTVNDEYQAKYAILTDNLSSEICVDRKAKELLENIPKCDLELFGDDVDKYFEKKTNERLETQNFKDDEDIQAFDSHEKGVDFEDFCVSLLKLKDFYNVSMTKETGDHGVDILAEKDDITYAIQCKYYSGSVGNSAIQEVFSGKSYYNRDIAVVMTNSTFTKQAIEDAAKLGVKLWDGEKIKAMFN